MLFRKRFWAGLADGSVTLTFRRWTRPQVVAGRAYRSPAGMLQVEAVEPVDLDTIGDDDAVRAGFTDAAELRRELARSAASQADVPLYRVAFHHAGADPREALREEVPEGEDLVELRRRLDRLDRAAADGPWTRRTLRLIAERPGVRAGDLAAALDRDTPPFKLDVRKLKALGLTESLPVGYRLAPRGRALLAADPPERRELTRQEAFSRRPPAKGPARRPVSLRRWRSNRVVPCGAWPSTRPTVCSGPRRSSSCGRRRSPTSSAS